MPPAQAATPCNWPSQDERRFPVLLRRAWFGLNQAFRRRIAHLNITPDQFTALRCLDESGASGLTQCELARRMCSDPNTVTSLVNRMENARLLARQADERDLRAHRLHLLPAGYEVLAAAREVAEALQQEILGLVPETQRARFLTQLALVAGACQDAAGEDGCASPPPAAARRSPTRKQAEPTE